MFFGYNSNGFSFHRLEDAVDILHGLGYQGVGLTLDVHHLNPFRTELADWRVLAEQLRRLKMRTVIETGTRFLLNPLRKHQPTLISSTQEGRTQRIDFLQRAILVAEALESDAVSLWSGTPDDDSGPAEWMSRLRDSMPQLLDSARKSGVKLALEPEPGMFLAGTLETLDFVRSINDPLLGLTIDVGHIHCLGEGEPAELLHEVGDRLFNVHLEDMRLGVHDHLMFGEGEIDFQPILEALRFTGYLYGAYVELSRHGYDAVNAAERSLNYLRRF